MKRFIEVCLIVWISSLSFAMEPQELTIECEIQESEIPGVRIHYFSSQETPLICPYFHQRYIAHDGTWFLCEGRKNDQSQLVRVDQEEGKGYFLTEKGAAAQIGDLGPKGSIYHFVRDKEIVGLDVLSGEECVRWPLPKEEGYGLSRLIHINADETLIAVSGNRKVDEEKKAGKIWTVSTKTGESRGVIEQDFQIGHVQCSTLDPKLIMYCHETGGAAPQRMWRARTTGRHPGPLFDGPGHPWVTHESFCENGKWVTFIRHPEGMGMIRPNNKNFIPIEAPGAWHCAGNEDASLVVFDTHNGSICLWERKTGKIEPITTGQFHGGKVHCHPRFFPDGKSVIWTSTRNGSPHAAVARLPE